MEWESAWPEDRGSGYEHHPPEHAHEHVHHVHHHHEHNVAHLGHSHDEANPYHRDRQARRAEDVDGHAVRRSAPKMETAWTDQEWLLVPSNGCDRGHPDPFAERHPERHVTDVDCLPVRPGVPGSPYLGSLDSTSTQSPTSCGGDE